MGSREAGAHGEGGCKDNRNGGNFVVGEIEVASRDDQAMQVIFCSPFEVSLKENAGSAEVLKVKVSDVPIPVDQLTKMGAHPEPQDPARDDLASTAESEGLKGARNQGSDPARSVPWGARLHEGGENQEPRLEAMQSSAKDKGATMDLL